MRTVAARFALICLVILLTYVLAIIVLNRGVRLHIPHWFVVVVVLSVLFVVTIAVGPL